MTRADLEALIATYMHRSDLGGLIPGFIARATRVIGRDLHSQANLTVLTFGITQAVMDLPLDYRGMRTVNAQADRGPRPLQAVSPTQIAKYQSAGGGMPAFYAISGLSIIVAPFTAGDLTLEYWNQPAALINGTSTNKVLDAYPDLYLYASLVEAGLFVRQPETVKVFAAAFNSDLFEINRMTADSNAGAIPAIGGA